MAAMEPVRRSWQWLTTHDRGLMALRRAGRAAIVMPAMFAIGDKVIANGQVATFAAFGSFALLMLVDFGGRMRDRLQAQAALAVTGAVFVCVGTLASREAWLAAAAMTIVGFGVLFVGVISSVLAGASTSLLLAFILPVSLIGTPSQIPTGSRAGAGRGGQPAGDRAAVARAGQRSAARQGGGRVPRAGGAAAFRGPTRTRPAKTVSTRPRTPRSPRRPRRRWPNCTASSWPRRTGRPA